VAFGQEFWRRLLVGVEVEDPVVAKRDFALGIVALGSEESNGRVNTRAACRFAMATVSSVEPESSTTTSSQPRNDARQPGRLRASLSVRITIENGMAAHDHAGRAKPR
jgi:hypothetical protein